MAELRVSELPLGNGWLGISPIPGRSSSYEVDLARLVAWGPSLVLTMVTTPELVRVGAEGLQHDLEALDIKWRHLPVGDFGAPEPITEDLWAKTSPEAHAILKAGGRVLAHCFGGCGRSGMALLRLMVEAGEDADPALERLRDARACAVETEGQRAWAAAPMFERLGWQQ